MGREQRGETTMRQEQEDTNAGTERRVYGRRTVIRAGSAIAGGAVLAASGIGTIGRSPTPTGRVVAQDAATEGKIPSPAPNVPDAYTTRPQPFKAVAEPPGADGPLEEINAFQNSFSPPPAPYDQNSYWQGLDERLGLRWRPTITPVDTYQAKLAATVAGGDVPDIVWLNLDVVPDQRKLIDQGAYADLTDVLDAEGRKEYPNLARIPDYAWQNSSIEGKIYGIPWTVPLGNFTNFFRRDWAQKLEMASPQNAEDVFRLLEAITKADPNGNGQPDTFAIANENRLFDAMFRAPNNWRLSEDGTLTKDYETAEWKQALAFANRVYQAGFYIPNAQGATFQDLLNALLSGRAAINIGGIVNLPIYRSQLKQTNPDADLYVLVPPGHDGGPPTYHHSQGFYGFWAISGKVGKDDEALRQVLRVVDWFAAPFGSEEHTYKYYGLEGTHHAVGPNGELVLTDKGRNEIGDMYNLMKDELTLYSPIPGEAQLWQDAIRDMTVVGIQDPTLGLYSPTQAEKASALTEFVDDAIDGFRYGRTPLSEIDAFVEEWRKRGGDQIRQEYEESLQRANR
jgi:putative aldouronate transport system substrate-binding protein